MQKTNEQANHEPLKILNKVIDKLIIIRLYTNSFIEIFISGNCERILPPPQVNKSNDGVQNHEDEKHNQDNSIPNMERLRQVLKPCKLKSTSPHNCEVGKSHNLVNKHKGSFVGSLVVLVRRGMLWSFRIPSNNAHHENSIENAHHHKEQNCVVDCPHEANILIKLLIDDGRTLVMIIWYYPFLYLHPGIKRQPQHKLHHLHA